MNGPFFPQTLPPNTVVGRFGAGQTGPAQAVPFSALTEAVATSVDITLYVSPSGNDSNDGSIGLPFLTPEKAVNVASKYNYQSLYSPAIIVADGTYTNVAMALPPLINCTSGGTITGNTGTPTNCTVGR